METPIVKDTLKLFDQTLKWIGLKPLPPPPPPPSPVPLNSIKDLTSNALVSSASTRNFIRLAGFSGTMAICLGVYGAHAMNEATSEDLKRLFQMAQNYHLLHSVALLGLPMVSRPMITGTLLVSGITLFCGPMYYHAIKNDARFRRVTPYGGLLLLAGWISILIF